MEITVSVLNPHCGDSTVSNRLVANVKHDGRLKHSLEFIGIKSNQAYHILRIMSRVEKKYDNNEAPAHGCLQ